MSAACLLVGTTALSLASPGFDLIWQHSVEKTEWRESWTIESGALRLTEAAVKGSGAGMDPGPDAELMEGWWVWRPDVPAVPNLLLAASGATASGWRICDRETCHTIGSNAGEPVTLTPCPEPL